MSQTIFEKLGVLFNATLHEIVNKALQQDPIRVLNEYLWQHEEAFDQMQTDVGVTLGKVRTAERHVKESMQIVARLNAEIEKNYTDGDTTNDYLLENLAIELVGKEDLLANNHRTLEGVQRAYSALLTGRTKLNGRIISLRNQIALLEAIQTEADIKGMTADILIKSARMVSSGVTSVEGLAESIKQNRDKADAKFELALEQLESTEQDSLVQGRADDKLAEIRARIGIQDEEVTTVDSSLDMSPQDLNILKTSQ